MNRPAPSLRVVDGGTPEAAHHRLVGEILQFRQDGTFRTWRDDRELELGTELLALMPSLTVGWLCWRNRKVVGQVMGRVAAGFGPPPPQQLPDMGGDVWIRADHLTLIDTTAGGVFSFTTSSDGGRRAIADLCTDFSKHRRIDPGSLPVVELGARNYFAHSKTIWAPIFEIVAWR